MNKLRLFELYEKIYFHELDVREKIAGRVQITFALVATAFTIISYMVRMLDYQKDNGAIVLFLLSILSSIILSTFCIVHLIKAFWGNTYKGIPSAIETEEYRQKMFTYKQSIDKYNFDNPTNKQAEVCIDNEMMNYIYDHYKNCSSHNTSVNDSRSLQIHDSFKWLLLSSIPLLFASALFIALDLDISSPRKETLIFDEKLVLKIENLTKKIECFAINDIKESNMPYYEVNDIPPPPTQPEAPEPRDIKENPSKPNTSEK